MLVIRSPAKPHLKIGITGGKNRWLKYHYSTTTDGKVWYNAEQLEVQYHYSTTTDGQVWYNAGQLEVYHLEIKLIKYLANPLNYENYDYEITLSKTFPNWPH